MKQKKMFLKKSLSLLAMCGLIGFSNVSTFTKTVEAKTSVESDAHNDNITKDVNNISVNKILGKKNTNNKEDKYKYKKVDLSNYKGQSIVDLLNSINLPSDVNFRSKLAVLYGVVDKKNEYKRTYSQNILLLDNIIDNGISLVIDKNTGKIVGCKNLKTNDVIFTNNKDALKKELSKIDNHEHKWKATGKYKSNNDGTHYEILKCSCGKTKKSKAKKCNKKIKLENGHIVIYCDKCNYEFSKIHIHGPLEYVDSVYIGNDMHESSYRCVVDGAIVKKKEPCEKVTTIEDGYKITSCEICENVFSKELEERPYVPSGPSEPVTPPKPSHEHEYTEYVGCIMEDGKHKSKYKCPDDDATITLDKTITEIKDGYEITYCPDCNLELSKVHVDHVYEETGKYVSHNDGTHSKELKCKICDDISYDEPEKCNYPEGRTETIWYGKDSSESKEQNLCFKTIDTCPKCEYKHEINYNHDFGEIKKLPGNREYSGVETCKGCGYEHYIPKEKGNNLDSMASNIMYRELLINIMRSYLEKYPVEEIKSLSKVRK